MTSHQPSATEFAISSLESLTDQVSHFIFPKRANEADPSPPPLDASFLQLRDLILETQMQFTRMEDKKRLQAAFINETLQQTNEKVMNVKAELKQLAMVAKPNNKSEGKPESLYQESMEVENVRRENARLTEELEKTQTVLQQVRELNQKLTNNNDTTTEQNQMKAEIAQLKRELSRCQEQIQTMKMDQKRSKLEKLDLLGQMRQLYGTLEDKERELKDFINIYEQRLTESENIIKQTAKELKEHNDSLKSEIEAKDFLIVELKQAIAVLSSHKSSDRLSKDSLTGDSLRSIGETGVEPAASVSSCSVDAAPASFDDRSHDVCHGSSQDDERTTENGKLMRKVTWSIRKENAGTTRQDESEVFVASNWSQDGASQNSVNELSASEPRMTPKSRIPACDEVPGNFSSSFQSDEDKARILSEAKETPPILWKADHVRAWLELEVHLPGYGKACSENIRSGRVLLSLSDSELNSCLGLQSPLHRRKLRLAIDELRQPEITYPLVSTVTPVWVAKYWLPSLGLAQFGSTFETQLVDGRLLNVLTKKDLEKHLSVLQKLHQSSIACGIKLLKSMSFDTRALTERRTKAVENNNDLIVWTNEQIINWIKSIDLGEFAENLQNSGIHGGLLVLDSSFTVDVLSRQLSIPSSKVPVLRRLSTELKTLMANATSKTKDSSNPAKRSSFARSPFIRSFRGGGKSSADDLSRQNRGSEKSFTLRGSLGRAFGKKLIKDQIRVIRTPDQDVAKSLPNIDDSAQQADDGRKRDRLI